MVTANDDLNHLLLKLGYRAEQLADGTFLVALRGSPIPVALRLAAPVVVARVSIGRLPAQHSAPLLRALLELNATELVHASYGLTGEDIVLSAALESSSLDPNELEALLAELDVALAEQLPRLRALARVRVEPAPVQRAATQRAAAKRAPAKPKSAAQRTVAKPKPAGERSSTRPAAPKSKPSGKPASTQPAAVKAKPSAKPAAPVTTARRPARGARPARRPATSAKLR